VVGEPFRAPGVHVDAIDGVPILWMEAPPPFVMTLMFRVGQADESLPNAGITHLVEHLAFPHDHREGVANNGTTKLLTTEFFAWGDPREAAEFLHRVSRGLGRAAADRLDQQRSIIGAEEARWNVTPRGELLIARYGARGPGLGGFRGLGLRQVGAAEVDDWVARYFTRGNAIIWMTGPPPQGLGVDLRDGPAVPAPQAEVRPGTFPRWTPKPQPFVAIGVAHPYGSPVGAASRILTRRLFARLRDADAVSYDIQAMGELVDRGIVHTMIVADCLPDAAPHVTNRIIQAADEFAESGPTAEEVADELKQFERALRDDPRLPVGWMHSAAERALNGMEVEEFEEDLERRRSETRASITDAWRDAMAGLALCTPSTVIVDDPRFDAGGWPLPLKGRTFHPPGLGRFTAGGARAVVSSEGVSVFDKDGQHGSVRFSATAALVHGDGAVRLLIAEDGSELVVNGASYANGNELVAEIDRLVLRDRHVRSVT
jgi:hypothetical protein